MTRELGTLHLQGGDPILAHGSLSPRVEYLTGADPQ